MSGQRAELSASQSSVQTVALQRAILEHSSELGEYLARQIPNEVRKLIEPQDVLQDMYFQASQRLPEFVPNDSAGALRWLKTIARNLLTDQVRAHRAAKRGGGQLIGDDELHHGSLVLLLHELSVYRRTPSRSAAAHELLEAIDRSLSQLAVDQRDAVRLRYLEGLSIKETANRMGRSEGSVQMLALRGLGTLRKVMRSASMYI